MEEKSGSFTKPIQKLFENDVCVVFDKPAGLLVIPSPKSKKNTLVNIVNHQYTNNEDQRRLHPCHRLDQDTSGCILFAKGKAQQKILMSVFQRRKVKKTYIALLQGKLKKQSGVLSIPLSDQSYNVRAKKSQAKEAITNYKVIQHKRYFTIVEVKPVTGRTNQIRRHFSYIGHPLVGDRKFSVAKNYPLKFKRTALHAQSLQWKDSRNQKIHSVESPLALDLQKFIRDH